MVTHSRLGDAPFIFDRLASHGMFANAKGQDTTYNEDELQKGADTAAPPQRPQWAPRQLLAAFVAVSVVIFLAYICAVSIQRRITSSPFSRQLAARGGGEEFDESDDSCSTESAADTSPEGQPTTTPPPDVSAEALQAQSGRSVSTSSTDTTAAASGKTVPGTAAPQVETQWRRIGLKRKGAEQSSVEREAKQLRPETTLQPPPSPLDPALDSLIDSLLAGADDPLSEDVWLLDEPPLLPAADSSIVSTPSTSRIDSEARPVETTLQSRAVETTPQLSPPPLDPGFDSLIDYLFSRTEHAAAEDVWIGDAEPPHPTPGLPSASMPPALGGDSEGRGSGHVAGKIVDVLPSMLSIVPGDHIYAKEEIGSETTSLAGSSGDEMQRESPAAVEAPHSEPSGNAAAQAREESPQAATAEELAVPETGVAISAKGQEEDSSPSSYRITPALLQHRWGVTLYEERDSPEQSESGTELLEEVTAFPPFRFLGELFPGVPDSILRTHPFYRYPESQDAPHCRNFDINVAMSFAATQVNANISLSKCRRLMKKPHLTEGDVGELLFEAERLCGYAMERMAVTYRRGQAMYATETLGTVFLVFDMLYCIAEVLGDRSMKEAWWPHIAARTEVIRYVPPREYSKAGKCGWNSHLARALDAALGYYRRGDRPPPRVVIGLKLALVCEPAERSKFRVKGYQPWRDDAREWKESIERSLAGKK